MDLRDGIERTLAAVGCTDLGWDGPGGGIGSGWIRRPTGDVHVQAWGDVNPVTGAAPGVFLRLAYVVDVGDVAPGSAELAPVRGLRVHPAWDEAAAFAELERALHAELTRGVAAVAS